MRIFTAIPLPKELKDEIEEISRGKLPVPYINTSNLHITLNFFGELTDSEVETVKSSLSKILAGQKKFRIEFLSLEKFHQQIHLKVKPSPELLSLQSQMKKEFEKLGFEMEHRNYYPHVKLANLHVDKVMNPQRKLENFPQEGISKLSFEAEKVILYESKLLLHHAKHIPLAEVSFS